MKTEHTATPWHLSKARNSGQTVVMGAGPWPVAELDPDVGYRVDEAQATAEFIVRACNAHDDLVKALENITYVAEHGDASAEGDPHETALATVLAKARAALSKAGTP